MHYADRAACFASAEGVLTALRIPSNANRGVTRRSSTFSGEQSLRSRSFWAAANRQHLTQVNRSKDTVTWATRPLKVLHSTRGTPAV